MSDHVLTVREDLRESDLAGVVAEAVPLRSELADLIVAQVSDAILVWNHEGKIVVANPAAQRLMGSDLVGRTLVDAEEILGETYDFLSRRISEGERPLAGASRGRSATNQRFQRIRADGSAYELVISATPLLGDAGRILGGVAILSTKVGSQKDTSAEENERLQSAVRKMSPGFLRTRKTLREDNAADGKTNDEVARAYRHILVRTLNALISEPNFRNFLDQLLIAITDELGAHSAALWFHDRQNRATTMHATSYRGTILSGDKQLGHPYAAKQGQFKQGLIARAQADGAFAIADVAESSVIEPEVRAWMGAQGVKSLLCIPLEFGKKVAGTLTIRGADYNSFTLREEQLGRLLTPHVSLAVHLMRLVEQAEESAVLEERTRIAQEMHDSLAQSLTAVTLHLELSKDDFGSNANAALSHVKLAQDLARESLLEAQRSVWALRPAALDGCDLARALGQMASRFTYNTSTRVEFSLHGTPRHLPQETEVNLLRICQEAVSNAVKHAEASKIRIELVHGEDAVRLVVEDDGQGFSASRVKSRRGFGLTNLRERAERVGGKATIHSQPNFGTRIAIDVPVCPCAKDGI